MSKSPRRECMFSRRDRRPSCATTRPSKEKRARGMPGAPLAPIALRAKTKRHASRSHHRSSRFTRHSPRNGFNGFLRALPGVRDVLVTVIGEMQSIVANLAPAKGRQNHTTSPSACRAARQAAQPRPPHSNPTLVTVAKRPSIRGRTNKEHKPMVGGESRA